MLLSMPMKGGLKTTADETGSMPMKEDLKTTADETGSMPMGRRTMRSMTQSNCPHWECLGAPLPLQIMSTNWPPVDEIEAHNSNLVVAIIEVIRSVDIIFLHVSK